MLTSGHVTSSEDGSPVIGASIKVAGTNTGTVTDIDGNFSLNRSEERRVGKECRSRWSPYH